MATLKVTEVLSQSEKSWEDATNEEIIKASKSLNNLVCLYQGNGGQGGE